MKKEYPKKEGYAWLGVLTWNTHMGAAVSREMWVWVVKFLPPLHLVMFQEVDDLQQLRKILGNQWIVVPWARVDDGRGTTYVAAKKRRFEAMSQLVKNIRFRSKHSRQVVALDLMDKQTNRAVLAGSLHLDPLGLGFTYANRKARRRHERQAERWADVVRDWRESSRHLEPVVIVAGDGNENLQENVPDRLKGRQLLARFHRAGLKPVHKSLPGSSNRVRLDEVWFSGDDVKPVRRIQFRPPTSVPRSKYLDHDLVYALLQVKEVS